MQPSFDASVFDLQVEEQSLKQHRRKEDLEHVGGDLRRVWEPCKLPELLPIGLITIFLRLGASEKPLGPRLPVANRLDWHDLIVNAPVTR